MKFIIPVLIGLLFNFTKPYFETFFLIVFRPSKVAIRIKQSLPLPLGPRKYLCSGLGYVFSVWAIAWAISKIDIEQFYITIIIIIYFCVMIEIFSILVWIFGYRYKSKMTTQTAYAYLIGTIAPLVLILIETITMLTNTYNLVTNIKMIEDVVIIIFSVVSINYIYRFLKIIHEVSVTRYLFILAALIVSNLIVVEIFMELITILQNYHYL